MKPEIPQEGEPQAPPGSAACPGPSSGIYWAWPQGYSFPAWRKASISRLMGSLLGLSVLVASYSHTRAADTQGCLEGHRPVSGLSKAKGLQVWGKTVISVGTEGRASPPLSCGRQW